MEDYERKHVQELYDRIVAEVPSRAYELPEKHFFDLNSGMIGRGESGHAYQISEGVAGKILTFCRTPISLKYAFPAIRQEFINQKLANNLGVRVAEPYELVLAKDTSSNRKCPMLTMRDLGRMTLDRLSDDEYVEAAVSRDDEIEKVQSYVKTYVDFHTQNAIWVPEEKQTYLIDCDLWNFKR